MREPNSYLINMAWVERVDFAPTTNTMEKALSYTVDCKIEKRVCFSNGRKSQSALTTSFVPANI